LPSFEDVPEEDRRGGRAPIGELQRGDPLGHLRIVAGRLGDPGEVALDIGEEDGNSEGAEVLGDGVDRDRLAGAGRAGDEAVAVRHAGQEGVGMLPDRDGHRWRRVRLVFPPIAPRFA